jgi:hypothetical protein
METKPFTHLQNMRHLFLISLVILYLPVSAQITASDSIKILKTADSTANYLGFGCGKAARRTPAVVFVENLACNSPDVVPLLIHSQNPTVRFLAIRLCEHDEKKGRGKLSQSKKELIKIAYHSEEIIKTCQGCTIREEKTLGSLLRNHEWDLRFWISRIERFRKN